MGAGGSQKFRPGLWGSQVGVIDVKQRKTLPCAGGELVEGPMVTVPLKRYSEFTETRRELVM